MSTEKLREIAAVCLGVAVALAAAELGVSSVYAGPPLLREADDAVADLARGDPDTMILGSSHARAFEGVRQRLAAETHGAHDVLIVPLELGRLSAYRWLLEHRLRPLVDETAPDGRRVRPSLRRLVLVTHWWDACFADDEPAPNLPARAWTLGDFARDVAAHGLTPHNRGYSSRRWAEATSFSTVMRTRELSTSARDDLVDAGIGRLRGRGEAGGGEPAHQADTRARTWQAMIERGYTDPRCRARGEAEARDAIFAFARTRGLELTVILFPLMPRTVTERARRTTLRDFSERVEALARSRGVRLLDWTTSSPLTDGDFQRDFDHPNASGVAKLADFGLSGGLRFLREPPASDPRGGAR